MFWVGFDQIYLGELTDMLGHWLWHAWFFVEIEVRCWGWLTCSGHVDSSSSLSQTSWGGGHLKHFLKKFDATKTNNAVYFGLLLLTDKCLSGQPSCALSNQKYFTALCLSCVNATCVLLNHRWQLMSWNSIFALNLELGFLWQQGVKRTQNMSLLDIFRLN